MLFNQESESATRGELASGFVRHGFTIFGYHTFARPLAGENVNGSNIFTAVTCLLIGLLKRTFPDASVSRSVGLGGGARNAVYSARHARESIVPLYSPAKGDSLVFASGMHAKRIAGPVNQLAWARDTFQFGVDQSRFRA